MVSWSIGPLRPAGEGGDERDQERLAYQDRGARGGVQVRRLAKATNGQGDGGEEKRGRDGTDRRWPRYKPLAPRGDPFPRTDSARWSTVREAARGECSTILLEEDGLDGLFDVYLDSGLDGARSMIKSCQRHHKDEGLHSPGTPPLCLSPFPASLHPLSLSFCPPPTSILRPSQITTVQAMRWFRTTQSRTVWASSSPPRISTRNPGRECFVEPVCEPCCSRVPPGP